MLPKSVKLSIDYLLTGHSGEPEELKRRIERLGVFPQLDAYFQHHSQQYGYVCETAEWQHRRVELMAQRLLWRSTFAQVENSLAEIPHFILKGLELGKVLYGSDALRVSSDVDILVSPTDWQTAESTLARLGYVRNIEPRLWATRQVELRHRKGNALLVDLHWSLTNPPLRSPSFDELWAASTPTSSNICRTLGEADLYFHLLMHAHQHLCGVKTLLDLAAFCDACGESTLNQIESSLKKRGIWNVAVFYAGMLTEMTGIAHPHSRECAWHRLGKLAARQMRGILDTRKTWHHAGAFVLGQDSELETFSGVLAQAASMLLMDQWAEKCRCFCGVVLDGPHFIGRWRHLSDKR